MLLQRRKGASETDRKNKINLASAFINRSPLKNGQNSSMISNTSFTGEPPCQNHPNKKGKYTVITDQIEDDQQSYYCQKCAILLASKGFEVKKFQFATDTKTTDKKKFNPREQQLNKFLDNLSDKIRILNTNKKQASQQLAILEENYEQSAQKIDQFFQQLYVTLGKHKNKQMHELSLSKKAVQQQLSTYLGYARDKIELLETMKQDIISSHESIVKDTPEQDYQLVMSHYQANISQLKFEPVNSSLLNECEMPAMQTIEQLLAQLFENGRVGNCFSFDSSKKNYE